MLAEGTNKNFQARLFQDAIDTYRKNREYGNEDYGGLTWGDIKCVLATRLEDVGFINRNTDEELQEGAFDIVEHWDPLTLNWAKRNMYTKEFVKEKILEGQPVLLSLRKYDENENQKVGHAVIAYDYNPATDTVYCHSGWGSNQHSTVAEIGYDKWVAALCLEFNVEHKCDNNYIYNGVGYCYHNQAITTYPHTHNFNSYYTSTKHGSACQSCFEKQEENHLWYEHVYVSNIKHTSYCQCGYSKDQVHVVKTTSIIVDGLGRRRGPCMSCGASILLDEGLINPLNTNLESGSMYSLNGSEMLPNGIIILVPEDEEAYFNGALQFYNLNEEVA